MIINDLDGYYIVFDTKNWNTELDTLIILWLNVPKVTVYAQFLKIPCIPSKHWGWSCIVIGGECLRRANGESRIE